MIISHEHRFVFVEVPHTGSHSIAEQLIEHYGGQPILRKHANVTQFLAQASAEERRYFKFATVRNPLDAATTDYFKLLDNHKGQYTNPAMLIENGGHLTRDHLKEFAFVQSGASFPEFFRRFRNAVYNNWFLVGDRHFDSVIRFESLQEGFAQVLDRLGIEQVAPVGHVNPTRAKRAPYHEFYAPEIHEQAARCYGPFMRKWGYEFPEGWGTVTIPRSSQLWFDVLDRSAAFAAQHVALDPDNKLIHRAKKTTDRLTGRFGSLAQ